MRVFGPTQGAVKTFVPTSCGNQADMFPAEIDFTIPTEDGVRSISLLSAKAFACVVCHEVHRPKKPTTCPGPTTAPERADARASELELYRKISRSFVVRVRNYEVRGKEIATGDDLAQFGQDEILAEVALEILGSTRIDNEQKKSSHVQPSSDSPAMPVSTGNAISAASTILPAAQEASATRS